MFCSCNKTVGVGLPDESCPTIVLLYYLYILLAFVKLYVHISYTCALSYPTLKSETNRDTENIAKCQKMTSSLTLNILMCI